MRRSLSGRLFVSHKGLSSAWRRGTLPCARRTFFQASQSSTHRWAKSDDGDSGARYPDWFSEQFPGVSAANEGVNPDEQSKQESPARREASTDKAAPAYSQRVAQELMNDYIELLSMQQRAYAPVLEAASAHSTSISQPAHTHKTIGYAFPAAPKDLSASHHRVLVKTLLKERLNIALKITQKTEQQQVLQGWFDLSIQMLEVDRLYSQGKFLPAIASVKEAQHLYQNVLGVDVALGHSQQVLNQLFHSNILWMQALLQYAQQFPGEGPESLETVEAILTQAYQGRPSKNKQLTRSYWRTLLAVRWDKAQRHIIQCNNDEQRIALLRGALHAACEYQRVAPSAVSRTLAQLTRATYRWWQALAETHSVLGTDALEALRSRFIKLANSAPEFSDIVYQRALLEHASGELKQSWSCLGCSIKQDPNYIPSRVLHAQIALTRFADDASKVAAARADIQHGMHFYGAHENLLKTHNTHIFYLGLLEQLTRVLDEMDEVSQFSPKP